MKLLPFIVLFGAAACTTGEVEMWSDAMHVANGGTIQYQNLDYEECDVDLCIRTVSRNGDIAYQALNKSRDYCRFKIEFNEGEYTYHSLYPHDQTELVWYSRYNRIDGFLANCGDGDYVFYEPVT